MDYKRIERDFVLRSLALLEQYDHCELKPSKGGTSSSDTPNLTEKYEVTLLINCLLGLIVVPTQRTWERIPAKDLNQLSDWGLDQNSDIIWGDPQHHIGLRYVIERIRNSVAHFNIEAIPTEDKLGRTEICAVKFHDKNGYNNPKDTFDLTMPVADLRKFVTKLAQALTAK